MRMTISSFSVRAPLAFLPFGYLVTTRLHSFRDLAYLIATSWVPPLWILLRVEELEPAQAFGGFLLGYLAFVSLYEIGYLVNDAWDASRHRDGRQRTPFAIGPSALIFFTITRLAVWAAIAILTGWLYQSQWLAAQFALIATVALHNWLTPPSLRLASFAQLAVLRFCLPIAALLSPAGWTATLTAALMLYLPLRYLAYADSKQLLAATARQVRHFSMLYLLISLPLVALTAALLNIDILAEIWVWLVVAHAGWGLVAGQASGAKP